MSDKLDKILEREDLFKQGYKPKQKVEITGELFSKLLGMLGEQNKEINHLKKAMEAIGVFLTAMENTNNEIAVELLEAHAKNIDKKLTHEVK